MSAATEIRPSARSIDPGGGALRDKVRALLWEECRVGGSIAIVTLVMGLLVIAASAGLIGVQWMRADPLDYSLLALGAPLALSVLLILNTDYSGHLVGGYSERVLRLPVPTYVAVAVSLCARTLFVFLVALVCVLVSYGWLHLPIGLNAVWMITVFYLMCQLTDWLRAPISGLTSLLLGAFVLLTPYALLSERFNPVQAAVNAFREPLFATGLGLFLILPALGAAYLLAVPVVHASRSGRRVGIPEIWEAPGRVATGRAGRLKPFRSATQAQIWYELRRHGWLMPTVVVAVWGFTHGVTWLYAISQEDSEWGLRNIQSFLPFIALMLGAAAHAAVSGKPAFRRGTATLSYALLRPASTEQFARCRAFANAIVLAPLLLLTIVLHFAYGGGPALLGTIGYTYSHGLASLHEIVWVFLPRALLTGLLAWTLMAGSTRLLILSAAGILPLILVIELLMDNAFGFDIGLSVLPAATFFIGVAGVALQRVGHGRLVSRKSAGFCIAAWLGVAWLLYGNAHPMLAATDSSFPHFAGAALVSLGVGALAPLPFLAIALDFRRNRHGSAPRYDAASGGNGPARRRFAVAASGLAMAALLWLGWPVEPAYEATWRSRGLPTNLEEADAWYPPVPPEENVALRYVELADTWAALNTAFLQEVTERDEQAWPSGYNKLALVGNAEIEWRTPVPPDVREQTDAYWRAVTSEIAPELHRIAESGGRPSRYPVDLTQGIMVDLTHLAGLRDLAREMRVDALHWALEDRPGRATNSILALFPIAESLRAEPVLISQLVRTTIVGMALDALEDTLARTRLNGNDLERIATTLPQAYEPYEGDANGLTMNLDRSMVTEALFTLDPNILYGTGFTEAGLSERISMPLRELYLSASAERIVRLHIIQTHLEAGGASWSDRLAHTKEADAHLDGLWPVAPLSLILLPALGRSYEAEFRLRTQLEVARTAIAVERYRRDHGVLPVELADLVPRYLGAAPRDSFSPTGAPLRYRPRDDGSYVVYSISRDMEDDGGEHIGRRGYHEGDLLFRGAALFETGG